MCECNDQEEVGLTRGQLRWQDAEYREKSKRYAAERYAADPIFREAQRLRKLKMRAKKRELKARGGDLKESAAHSPE